MWVVKRERVRIECLSSILTYAGVLFCMGENVWESVVSESREKREGEGRVVVVGGRGRASDGKAGHRFLPALSREGGHSKGRKRDAAPALRLAARPAGEWPVLYLTVLYRYFATGTSGLSA